MTPEGRVKEQVKQVLKRYAPYVYGHWIVQNGMGTPTLDYIGCCYGRYFTIETKAAGEKLTPRQEITASKTVEAFGTVFTIEGENSLALDNLARWLDEQRTVGYRS